MSKQTKTTYETGVQAERRAVAFLQRHGCCVLAQRYRTELGEIDIIAQRDQTIHIIEVKHRTRIREARECLTSRQCRRIEAAAEIFASSHPHFQDYNWQLDAIFVTDSQVCWLENAWECHEDVA